MITENSTKIGNKKYKYFKSSITQKNKKKLLTIIYYSPKLKFWMNQSNSNGFYLYIYIIFVVLLNIYFIMNKYILKMIIFILVLFYEN